MRSSFAVLVFVAGLAGCSVIPHERLNDDCAWMPETPRAWSRQHLRTDAALAEELSIRYADTHRGLRSGHFINNEEYGRSRDQCLTQLVQAIADSHGVPVSQVRDAIRQRSLLADLVAVFLPMATLYVAAGTAASGYVFRRFERDEIVARVCSMLVLFVIAGILLYQVGSVWSFVFEERIRLATPHLSYRAFFLPWTRHPLIVMASGSALFWSAAALAARPQTQRRAP